MREGFVLLKERRNVERGNVNGIYKFRDFEGRGLLRFLSTFFFYIVEDSLRIIFI